MVNTSVENALVHYVVHTALVSTAFLLWMPVCGPLPELRISYPAQMLYLFVTSIIPTVPAGVADVRRGGGLLGVRHARAPVRASR